MKIHGKKVTTVSQLLATMGAAIVLIGGCRAAEDSQVTIERPSPPPLLAAARARRITMFGDLSDGWVTENRARAGSSLRRHTFTKVGDDTDVHLDPTGRWMVFSSTRHSPRPNLYLKAVEGTAVTQLTSDPAGDLQPAFSPDGTQVAFASDRSGNWDIWVISVDRGQPVQITDDAAAEVHPSWSPDGTKLVYCSLPVDGGPWELWIAGAESGSTRKFIGFGVFPEWSPASDTIVYQRARERGSHLFSIWTVALVDGEPCYPTELAAHPTQGLVLPTFNRDGSLIAFASIEESPRDELGLPLADEALDIWVMSADGRGKMRLTDGHSVNTAPAFAPDGRVFFTARRSGQDNIWSLLPTGPHWGPARGDQLSGDPRDYRPPPGTKG